MEDAARALLMAGNVLIFIIALTVCISSFSTLRAGIDNIIDQTETVQMAKTADDKEYINFIQSRENGAIRTVGSETVVSSMYRSIKEDYVIYIKINDTARGAITTTAINWYDAKETLKVKDINGNEKTVINPGDKIIKVTIGNGANQEINAILKVQLYDQIRDFSFYEYLGEYKANTDGNEDNKKIYRVITYIDTKCFT